MTDSILLRFEAGKAALTLNRPDRLNSFNAAMHQALHQALDTVADSDARVLLLTGSGRGFCAGQDLGDRKVSAGGQAPDLGASLDQNYNPTVRRLRALEMPVICAVNGVAAGAGASLALACDIVIAARSASFIQAFCKLGLVPDTARAMGLALLGDRISAEQALAWGLIWDVADDDALMDAAHRLADHFATQPTRGLAMIKRAIYASGANDLDAQLDLERDLQREAGRTDDYREGVAAFMEKRTPRFKGR